MTSQSVRVTAQLQDGSRILGSPTRDSLSLHTQYATLSLPIALIRTIEFSDTGRLAVVSLQSGERLRGVLEPRSLSITSIVGTLTLPFEQVVSLTILKKSPSLDASLVAFYPFDGNAMDISGNNHNGTVHGPTLGPDRWGRADRAYSFDGNDSYISIPDGLIRREAATFTLSLWLLTNDLDMNRMALYIGAAEGEASVQLKDGQIGLFVTLDGKQYIARSQMRPDAWIHVVGVYRRGKTCQLWTDGEMRDEIAIPTADLLHALPSHTSTIGSYAPAHLDHAHAYSLGSWKGAIDEVRIYGRALDPEEIEMLFTADR